MGDIEACRPQRSEVLLRVATILEALINPNHAVTHVLVVFLDLSGEFVLYSTGSVQSLRGLFSIWLLGVGWTHRHFCARPDMVYIVV